MKKIAAIIFALLLPWSAHAQTTKTLIISDINTMFADNTSNAITALMLRTVTTEIVSSYVDWLTCTTSPTAGSLIYYLNNSVPTCLPMGSAGQYLRSNGVSPSWQSIAANLTAGSGIGITGTITPTILVSDVVLNGLQTLAATGFPALTAVGTPDTFSARTMSASTGINISNPAGIAGNPAFSIANTIAAGGPTGSATVVPTITYNAQGQLTAVTSNTILATTLLDVLGSAQGDLLYRGSGGWTVITPGTSGQVLTTQGASANPTYTTVSGTGTVTSLTCGSGLTCSTNPITTSGTITPTIATAAQFEAGTANNLLDANVVYTPEVAKTFAGTMTFDFNTFINASVILTANITSVTCSNIKTGQAGQISYIQDGSGSHTAVYCSQFRFAGATTPTLTTSASAVDVMSFGPCRSSSWCPAALLKGFNP